MSRQRFLQLLLFALYCASSNSSPLVGTKIRAAKRNEFPFMVSLSRQKTIKKKENHRCGGALISNRHVLTAAHCFENRDPEDYVVLVGSVNIESGKQYQVESWVSYDQWAVKNNKTTEFEDNDIGIVTLSRYVKDIQPAIISAWTPEEVIGRKVVTAGWGCINETTKTLPDSLQKARLKVISLPEYEEIMRAYPNRIEPSPNNYMTTAYPTVILGCGDSGSPLLLESNYEIVGVNESSCNVVEPDEYNDVVSYHVVVDYYRDFIEDITWK